jgi:excisionase family DNA binding protein
MSNNRPYTTKNMKYVESTDEACTDNTSMNVWLNTEEAAAYLSTPKGCLLNMTSNGLVPFYKLGRSNRYLKKELDELLMKSRRGPKSD